MQHLITLWKEAGDLWIIGVMILCSIPAIGSCFMRK